MIAGGEATQFKAKTHCIHGHELNYNNLYIRTRDDRGVVERLCRKCRSATSAAYRKTHPQTKRTKKETQRLWDRKRRGILNPTGEIRVGICELGACKEPLVEKKLAYDHDHATGKHRGWLCTYCNTMLGHYEKHAARCEAYLQRSKAESEQLLLVGVA